MALLPARGNLPPNDLVSSLQSSRSPYISSPTSIGSATSSPFAVPAVVAALAIGAGAYALNQHYTAPVPMPAAPISVIAPPAPPQTDDSDLKITHEHVDQAESDLASAASRARNDAAAFVPSSAQNNQMAPAAAPTVNFAGSAPPTAQPAPAPAPDAARSSMVRALAAAGPTLSIVSSFVSAGSAAGGDDGPAAGAPAPGSVPQQVSFDKNSATTTVTFGTQPADAVPAPTVEAPQSPSMATAPVTVPQLLPQPGGGPDKPYFFVETGRDTMLEAQVQPWVAQTYSVSVPLSGGATALVHVMNVKSGNLPVPAEMNAAVAIALERSEFGCSRVPSPNGGASYLEYNALSPNASVAELSTYQSFGRHTASINGPRKPFEIWYYGPFTGAPTDGPSGSVRVQQGIASFPHMKQCAECKGLLPE